MEIIIEQIRQEIAKEVTREILEECIGKIDKEIKQDQSASYEVSQFYINGLKRAKNIIKEIKRERYL